MPIAKPKNNRNDNSDIREETKSFDSYDDEEEEIEITNSYEEEDYDDESGSYDETSRGNSRVNASYKSGG